MSLWMQGIVNRLDALPCPTIAAIGADAYGGGCELALACDMRVIAPKARLHFRQVAMGLTPGWGGGQRLARLIGRSRAIFLLATAAAVEAPRALGMGLVDEIADDALDRAEQIGRAIAKHSTLAVRNTKRAIVRGAEMPLRAAIDFEAELFAECWGSEAHHAAVARFLEKGTGSRF